MEDMETPKPLVKAKRALTFIDMENNSDEPVIVQQAAGKRPAHLSQFIDDECEEEEQSSSVGECPNLRSYFKRFDVPKQEVIGMCRTYANCLAAELKAERASKINARE